MQVVIYIFLKNNKKILFTNIVVTVEVALLNWSKCNGSKYTSNTFHEIFALKYGNPINFYQNLPVNTVCCKILRKMFNFVTVFIFSLTFNYWVVK